MTGMGPNSRIPFPRFAPMLGATTPAGPDYRPPSPPWEWNWSPPAVWQWEPSWDESSLDDSLEGLAMEMAIDALAGDSFGLTEVPPAEDYFPVGYFTGVVDADADGEVDVMVGWSQPPHPIDWIPSVNPNASFREQARAVLYDYFHDDELRSWADHGEVKDAFGYGKGKAIHNTADYDPITLIQAYENPKDPVWTQGKGAATWAQLDKAVRGAVRRRLKLGPLPQSSYSTHPGPVVVYYYDHDRMKKIVYPTTSVVPALQDQHTWWKVDGVHTHETQDPNAIALERKSPGDPGGGKWGNEGFDAEKDFGQVGSIFGVIMEAVGAVIQVIPGIGTAVGSALSAAGAAIQSITAAIGNAMLGADNAAALAGLAQVVLKVAGNAGFHLPPDYAQAISSTINTIAQAVSIAQRKYTNFSDLWGSVAQKANQLGSLGDKEAEIIAKILGENEAGKFFIDGYTVGKFAKLEQIEAIAEIVKGYATFVQDPKALNFFLLGAGIGHLTSVQAGQKPPQIRKAAGGRPSPQAAAAVQKQRRNAAATAGSFRTGAAIRAGALAAHEDLEDHIRMLGARHMVGQIRSWDPIAWGCPVGYWKDPLSGECMPRSPVCPDGRHFDMATGTCVPSGSW